VTPQEVTCFSNVKRAKVELNDVLFSREFRKSHFFKLCDELLERNGRLYLQTMLFGKRMIDPAEISKNAPGTSDARMLWLLEKAFPGSWPPSGEDQVLRTAAPYFDVISLKLDFGHLRMEPL
jgi:hypothetical protein